MCILNISKILLNRICIYSNKYFLVFLRIFHYFVFYNLTILAHKIQIVHVYNVVCSCKIISNNIFYCLGVGNKTDNKLDKVGEMY